MLGRSKRHDEEVSIVPCDLCGSTEIGHVPGDEDGGRVVCSGCGLVRVPLNNGAELARASLLASDCATDEEEAGQPLQRVYRAGRTAQAQYQRVRPYLRSGYRVLDVCSGTGEFLYLLVSRGIDAQGMEPRAGCGDHAISEYGLNVWIGFSADIDLPEHSFDVITLFGGLNYASSPRDTLRRLAHWLVPGGKLVVEVQNVEKAFHKNCNVAPGLFEFNRATLECLGRSVGMDVIDAGHAHDGRLVSVVLEAAWRPEQPPEACRMPDNARQVLRTLRKQHRATRWLSGEPLWRRVARERRERAERRRLSRYQLGRAFLDDYYKAVTD